MTNLQAIFPEEELESLVNKHPARLAQVLRTPDCVPELMKLIMQAEVTEHCGIPQKHSKTKCKRWGSNPGSVFWNGTRTPIQVPRVRNTEMKKEVPLETYTHFHVKNSDFTHNLMRSVLHGLSRRKFGQTAAHVADSFGRSGSTAGHVFKEETQKALEHFMTRRFDDLEFVAILIDGKTLRQEQILLAVGLTTKGEKIILGFVEAKTRFHSRVVVLLQDLQERGFRAAKTLLVLLNGAKALRKGVLEVFGDQVLIQQCP